MGGTVRGFANAGHNLPPTRLLDSQSREIPLYDWFLISISPLFHFEGCD
jgi:hypothetical protein